MKFRVLIDRERCKGCELCIAACPENVLNMSEERNSKGYRVAAPVWQNDCTGCKACAMVCPDAAVEIMRDDEPSQGE